MTRKIVVCSYPETDFDLMLKFLKETEKKIELQDKQLMEINNKVNKMDSLFWDYLTLVS
jgi:hypothetical protein